MLDTQSLIQKNIVEGKLSAYFFVGDSQERFLSGLSCDGFMEESLHFFRALAPMFLDRSLARSSMSRPLSDSSFSYFVFFVLSHCVFINNLSIIKVSFFKDNICLNFPLNGRLPSGLFERLVPFGDYRFSDFGFASRDSFEECSYQARLFCLASFACLSGEPDGSYSLTVYYSSHRRTAFSTQVIYGYSLSENEIRFLKELVAHNPENSSRPIFDSSSFDRSNFEIRSLERKGVLYRQVEDRISSRSSFVFAGDSHFSLVIEPHVYLSLRGAGNY